MGKKLLDSKILYMVLALLMAVSLWVYVNMIRGELHTTTISNIPVTFVGTDVLRENRLMIVGETPTVDLEVQANVSTLARLDKESFTLRVDVSHITSDTDYTLSYDIVPPAGISASSYTVVQRTPANVNFHVVRYITRTVPVHAVLAEGSSIAEGYVAQGWGLSQDTIEVSGQSDLVEQVKYVLVTLGGEEMSETVKETKSFRLMGVDNRELTDLDVTCSTEYVEVTYRILKVVEVPLKLNLISGGGVSAEDTEYVSWELDPVSVSVLGNPEDLESLKELTVGSINLADVDGTVEQTLDIPLAEGLDISGRVKTVNIRVTVSGLLSQGYLVGRDTFTIINEPEGYSANVRTQSLAVTLRGTEEALELANPENIRVTVDLKDVELVSGQCTVLAKVQFDGPAGVGVLGTNYQVVVHLTKKQQ